MLFNFREDVRVKAVLGSFSAQLSYWQDELWWLTSVERQQLIPSLALRGHKEPKIPTLANLQVWYP